MKRYASIDFLRGLAIFLMLWVHTMQRFVFRDRLYTEMGTYSLFVIIFLMAILFLGSWAGLFLMVSSTGSMLSMQNGLERNPKVGSFVFKQVMGGSLLIVGAIITETITGYNAFAGEFVYGDANQWVMILYRGFHFETIHAVGWCVILNGITHGILSLKGGWKKINRNIKIYFVLILIVVIFTPSVWNFVQKIIPGYPYETREPFWGTFFGQYVYFNDLQLQYGVVGYDKFGYLVKLFFLAPLSGQVEPIFPFLAVSYIGSIIGLFLLRKQKEMDGFGKGEGEYDVSPMKNAPIWLRRVVRLLWFAALVGFITFGVLWQFSVAGDHFKFLQLTIGCFMIFFLLGILLYYFREKANETVPYKLHTLPVKVGMMIGFALFLIGMLGVVLIAFTENESVVDTLMSAPYDVRLLWESGTWLWWFCVQTGAQIGAFCLLLRVTEFRGKTHKFGERTLFFRRFGMVPFSVYNFQFIDAIPAVFLALLGPIIPIFDYSSRNGRLFPAFGLDSFGVYGIWIMMGLLLLMYWLFLWLWQKIHFAFGFEWFLAKISNVLIPSKRKAKQLESGIKKKTPWWQARRLNVKDGLISPNWVDVIKEEHIPRQELVDSKLSAKLSWVGLLIAPVSLITLGVARTAIKKEGWNKYSRRGLIISIFGVVLAATILIGTMFIFGISL
ncbi:MAG: hypothetical protein ACTSRE_04475 [Promethearchaeota archaeon]